MTVQEVVVVPPCIEIDPNERVADGLLAADAQFSTDRDLWIGRYVLAVEVEEGLEYNAQVVSVSADDSDLILLDVDWRSRRRHAAETRFRVQFGSDVSSVGFAGGAQDVRTTTPKLAVSAS